MKNLILLMACSVVLPTIGFIAWAFIDLAFNKPKPTGEIDDGDQG